MIPEQCLHCGRADTERTAFCQQCGHPLVLDVTIEQLPADERTLFAVAKLVAEHGTPAPSFGELRNRLRLGDRRVLSSVPRPLAQKVLDALIAAGIPATAGRPTPQPAVVAPPPPETRSGRGLYLSLGAFLILVLLFAVVRQPPVLRWLRRHVGVLGLSSEQIARLGEKSIATVSCEKRLGIAVFTDYDTLLAAAHVTCPLSSEVSVQLKDGTTLVGKVAARDDDLDLARITVPMVDQVTPMPIGDILSSSPGDTVTFFDVAAGAAPTAYAAKLDKEFQDILGIGYFPLTPEVALGDVGGPFINRAGEVVGVVSREKGRANSSLMLPIHYAHSLLAFEPSADEQRRWARFASRVEELDKKEASEIATRIREPALAGVDINPQGVLYAVLMLRSETLPKVESLNLELSLAEKGLCHIPTRVVRWIALKEAAATYSGGTRLQKWYEHHGMSQGVYLGIGLPDLESCTEAATAAKASFRLGEVLPSVPEVPVDLGKLRAFRPRPDGTRVAEAPARAGEDIGALELRLEALERQRESAAIETRRPGPNAIEADSRVQSLDNEIGQLRQRLQALRSAH